VVYFALLWVNLCEQIPIAFEKRASLGGGFALKGDLFSLKIKLE
jgi:hypothetical protein